MTLRLPVCAELGEGGVREDSELSAKLRQVLLYPRIYCVLVNRNVPRLSGATLNLVRYLASQFCRQNVWGDARWINQFDSS